MTDPDPLAQELDAWRNRPRDIVRRPPLTDTELLALHDNVGQYVTITTPGEVLLDTDGIPTGVGPSTSTTGTLAAPVLTPEMAERLHALLAERGEQ